MTGAWANVDGWIGPAHDARVSPVDAGFLYGEAVYENLRTYGHVPFLFTRHLARLRRSADFLGIPLAPSDAEITARLRATQEASGIAGEHSLRVILTAGPQGGDPSLIILVRPLPPLPVDPEHEGVGVFRSDWVRAAPGWLPADVKSTNLLGARLAVREAEAAGAHEAVIRGSGGDLTEGATSNLFVVDDGVILTPPLEEGLLPGITRALVLEVLRELEIPFEETPLGPRWLTSADEAFLTSSSREVLPITWSVAPGEPRRTIGNGKPGALTLRALAGYRRAVNGLLAESRPGRAHRDPP
ncbi:MAG: aminotransferase [Acidobacteria bacterium]|nr:aminotransferase [Acidobacteriota bacterium]MYG74474.1 aminotransferase [Acidobacteriota bacterium]